ncbi:SDR family NAD(P)-dependent oxidoreductase [Halorarius halobius]|uniref:SDR family NAD(P)-dependent oxidoreductase n=1 Tax=Halorarius halobius TaxID=2962671 RepID=UPI0020CB7B85|nr:SDR family NAD(P)-dependent oxidoreductase [Halorarius halobius]
MKTALITGATSGIGRDAARRLGERGWRVLVHGRDAEAGAETVEQVERAGGEASFHAADFADLESVRALAAEVRETADGLDALCNNAGLTVSERRESEQGYELTIAVNHLAGYLLTHELVDVLADDGRVVTTASIAHRNGDIDFELLAEAGRTGEFGIVGRTEFAPLNKLGTATGVTGMTGMAGFAAYSDSKLANVLFTRELADRLDGPTATCFHPGIVPGSGVGRELPFPASLAWESLDLVPGVSDTVEDGGAALAYLAASDDVEGVTGAYFDKQRRRTPSREARSDANAERLWSVSADLVDVDEDWP